jgi:diguanylate cyclase (GGDEF)-like protein
MLRNLMACTMLLALLFSAPALALRSNVAMTNFHLQNWYSDDGLPHNTVHSIAQSSDGYLWFATWNGLARFNGRSFKVFNNETDPSFQTNGVRAVAAGSNGEVWAALTRSGLFHFQDRQWKSVDAVNSAGNLQLSVLRFARDGTLWIGTQGQGVLMYQVASKTLQRVRPEDGIEDTWVQGFFEDTDGSMWIAGARGLMRYRQGKLDKFENVHGLKSGSPIFSVLRDRRGVLWVGGELGLFRLKTDGKSSAQRFDNVPLTSNTAVQTLSEDSSGNLWVGTQSGGLLRLKDSGEFDRLLAARGLANNRVLSLLEDREGSLWIGTNAGLTRLSDSPFFRITNRDGLRDEFIRSIFPSASGSVWIGTSRGLGEFRNGKVIALQKSPVSRASITSVMEDQQARLWVGTYDAGVSVREAGQWRTLTRADSALPSNQVRALLEARDGSVWIGSAQGLLRINGTEARVYRREDGLPRDYVLSLMQSADGSIWVGTVNGFAILQGEQVQTFESNKDFPADDVFHFQQDGAGVVWLATDRGLVRFHNGSFEVFGRAQGLPDETIFSTFEDRKGHFWLSSNSGLMRLSRLEIAKFERGETKRMQVDMFGRADGMSAAQINGASFPSTSVDSIGRLWLPTARGVTVLDPEHLAQQTPVPAPIVLESVRVDQQEQPVQNRIEIRSDEQRVEFTFAGLSYVMAERLRIRYRLLNYDRDWVEAGMDGKATYTSLAPGTYRLEAQAGSPRAGWSAPLAIELKIHARIYQHWLFWFTLSALSAAMVLWLMRSRREQREAKRRELEALVASRTLELSARNANLAAADAEKSALLKTIQMQAEAFARQAREDALTGLPNRRFFDLRCAQAFTAAREANRHLVVAIADLDFFKSVNDQYSHQQGDAVLKGVAEVLSRNVNAIGLVARFGGEEFAMFFHDLALPEAQRVLENIRSEVEQLRFDGVPDLRLTISIGVSDAPQAESYERALREADIQLYLAKSRGRNRVEPAPVGGLPAAAS